MTTIFDLKPDPMIARDLVGYGEFPPHPAWPGGALIAVNFNLNVEGGGEASLFNGDPRACPTIAAGRPIPAGARRWSNRFSNSAAAAASGACSTSSATMQSRSAF